MKHFQSFWNIMLATDSYKASHHAMLPEGLTYMESYCESRGGEFSETVFFGLQYYMESYLVGQQVTEEKIQEAVAFYNEHFGIENVFNEAGWRYILERYNGFLPIEILSVDEGMVIPTKNMLFKIRSTDEKCVWLVNWVETLLMKLWYPITIATNSMYGKRILNKYYDISGDTANTDFMLHDFGYRGVASEEQAWLGGAAHLLSFSGSDTIAGIRMLQNYYGAPMCGFSVPASEHMVMTVRGRDNEIETYRQIIKKHGKGTIYENVPLSLVSDTYDIANVCHFLSDEKDIREMILERPGTFVIRPDSGDPVTVLLMCLEILAEKFGFIINEKGFKTINPKLKLLQGDGISVKSMETILEQLTAAGWSLDNFIFGSGGGILQSFNRDTLKFAIKASFAIVDGKQIDVYKDPITSKGKASKKGILHTLRINDQIVTLSEKDLNELHTVEKEDLLKSRFFNGVIRTITTYEDVKAAMTA